MKTTASGNSTPQATSNPLEGLICGHFFPTIFFPEIFKGDFIFIEFNFLCVLLVWSIFVSFFGHIPRCHVIYIWILSGFCPLFRFAPEKLGLILLGTFNH